jgi:hypothetical protein
MDGSVAEKIVSVAPSERRTANRVGVMMMATLRAARGFFDCMVLDLSSGGAKLAMGDHVVLTAGLPVTLIIQPYGVFRAQAVWQRLHIAGICFLDPPDAIVEALSDVIGPFPTRRAD